MSSNLKIIFAGSPVFSVRVLNALHAAGHTICAVFTQPDRPAGRGRQLATSPVKQAALAAHLPLFQPVSLRDAALQQHIIDMHADMMIVVAYGLILPEPVLRATRLGCINVHPSLLPRWRGAAPIERALLAGESETGVTIMQMDRGLDTGDMLYRVKCPILPSDTSASLHDRLAQLGSEALLKALEIFPTLIPETQVAADATYANKISREEAHIVWHESAEQIALRIRGFYPRPIAFTLLNGQPLRVWQAAALREKARLSPGEIERIDHDGIFVATGAGVLRLEVIQLPGGRALSVANVLLGHAHTFNVGMRLI